MEGRYLNPFYGWLQAAKKGLARWNIQMFMRHWLRVCLLPRHKLCHVWMGDNLPTAPACPSHSSSTRGTVRVSRRRDVFLLPVR